MMNRFGALAVVLLFMMAPFSTLTQIDRDAPKAPMDRQGAVPLPPAPESPPGPTLQLDKLQGFFTENLGQVSNPEVRYFTTGSPMSVGLTPRGVIFTMFDGPGGVTLSSAEVAPSMVSFQLTFVDCQAVLPRARAPLSHTSNFFFGSDPKGWVRGAANFAEVWYDGVFPGIDLRFYFKDGTLKYDFIVGMDGDPASIRLEYEGVDGVSIEDATGDMLVRTCMGIMRDSRPVVAPSGDQACAGLEAEFELKGAMAFGFKVPGEVLSGRPFIIDPGLRACTLLGTAKADDSPFSVALDAEGNIIVGVLTRSSDFPTTPGAYNRTWHGLKGCVLKLDPTLSTLIFSTFYGGTHSPTWGECIDWSIDVLRNESILIVGYTITEDFPVTQDAFDKDYNGAMDLFIMVMGPDGDRLEYASYFGGMMDETSSSTFIDEFGALYIVGLTFSSDLPTTGGAYQRTKAKGMDLYIVKFDISLRHLQFCTYLGGSSNEYIWQGSVIGCDIYKNIYVVGYTDSKDFPTTANAYHPAPQGNPPDMFFVKLNINASKLLYGTYIGGDSNEYPVWLHVTQVGMAYIFGYTNSIDFPLTMDANDTTMDGSNDGFLLVLDVQGRPWYSSFIGGDGSDTICGAVLDEGNKRLLIAGITSSTDLPCTPGCYNPYHSPSENNLYVIAISYASYTIEYCTYFGSTDVSAGIGEPSRHLCINRDGALFIPGNMKGTDFPTTTGALNRNCNGLSWDGFVISIDPSPVPCPQAPRGLKAVAGDGQVKLDWDVPTNESYVTLGHSIYRGLTPFQLDRLANVTTNTSYLDTDVTNGKRYYYELRAFNSMGEGDAAGPVLARPMGPLTEPLDLSASTGNGTVVLTWRPPASTGGAEVLGYLIMRGTSERLLTLYETTPPQENFTDTGVLAGSVYWYAVIAFNERGNGTMCLPIVVKALARPSAPEGFEVRAGCGWVSLGWGVPLDTGGAPILGFNVYRGRSPQELAFLLSRSRYELDLNDSSVEGGLEYYYQVVAYTSVGEGRPTAVIRALPSGVPGPPMDLVLRPGDKQVSISWSAPSTDRGSPVTGYRVYSGPDPATLVEVARLGDIRQYVRRGIENGPTYFFAVSAININGEGPRGATLYAVPLGTPNAPVNLTLSVGTKGVLLRWSPPPDREGSGNLTYMVLRGMTKTSLTTMGRVTEPLEYEDASAQIGLAYFYSVLAVNPYGVEGARALPMEVLMAFVPGSVSNLNATAGDGVVNLTWAMPATTGGVPIKGFIILRGTSEDGLIEIGGTTATTYEDVFVTNGERLWYAVRAMNAAGAGPQSSTVDATPRARPPPPEGLRISFKDGKATLRWVAPSGDSAPVTGYIVSKGASMTDMGTIIDVGLVMEYIDGQVEPGKVYFYTVRARSSVGEGAKAVPVKLEVPKETGAMRLVAIVLGLFLVALVALLVARRRGAGPMATGGGIGEPAPTDGPMEGPGGSGEEPAEGSEGGGADGAAGDTSGTPSQETGPIESELTGADEEGPVD